MASSPADSLLQSFLQGVGPAWLPLFDMAGLAEIAAALAPEAATLAPPPRLVFEAFRYGAPSDVVAVIVGQDPFPTPGHAQGLCFSVPAGVAPPPALRRVFACLARAGLRREGAALGDLRPWAAQGVLLLNAALTTRVGARDAHGKVWKPFVAELLRRLGARQGERFHFLLWGGPARAHALAARRAGHAVHEWSHPSPVGDNSQPPSRRFRECPHFTEVNEALAAAGRRPIRWDNTAGVMCFVDGSCPRNGQPDALAAFAAIVVGAQFGRTVVRGDVAPFAYAFVDEGDPERGVCPLEGKAVVPTNNRGEYLALTYAFLALLHGRAVGPVEIVSDCNNGIRTLLEWYPDRLRKGTAARMKNHDLVAILWRLFGQLKAQTAEVVLTHTRGHQPRPPPGSPPREQLLWLGNNRADHHAGLAARPAAEGGGRPGEVEVLEGPAVVRRALASGPVLDAGLASQ